MTLALLFLTALTLGLRHGLDFDHIAAMLDMAGTSATERSAHSPRSFLSRRLRTIKLPALYVLGHGLMILILGLAALAFGAVLPAWLDKLMERIVGITLLLLSAYLIYSLMMFLRKGSEIKLRSRWMLAFSAIAHAWYWLKARLFGRAVSAHAHTQINWDAKGAFLVGLIHGIGAETGTQVLLFASVAGASLSFGFMMLTAFTIGMAISTLAIAICVSAGLTSSSYFKPVLFVLGVLAAFFSLVVGLYFTFGFSGLLPSF